MVYYFFFKTITKFVVITELVSINEIIVLKILMLKLLQLGQWESL